MATAWWLTLFPGLAIVVLVMGMTLMGEGLNEALNPAIRVRRLLQVRILQPAQEGKRLLPLVAKCGDDLVVARVTVRIGRRLRMRQDPEPCPG